jgi:Spy/CpxP family protein refolding chaperone
MLARDIVAAAVTALVLTLPAGAEPPGARPVAQEELGRALDELAGQIQGLGDWLRGHLAPGEGPAERPLISIMLEHRAELGLAPSQVQELERIRTDFQRDAIRLDADQRVAQMDLAALLRADPVDMGKVETKVREVERLRGDLRLGRIRAIERGKAQLTPDQRAKLQALLSEPPPRPRGGGPPGPRF